MSGGTLEQAADVLRGARKAVALTGAGVSTESGIPDFRSAGGLWSRFDPMEYGTLGAFLRDPARVWEMLAELLGMVDAEPNPGHIALARLETMGLLAGIITQNIDGLHQKAGSRNVVDFHGSFRKFTCLACARAYPENAALRAGIPPRCTECSSILKPDIVFFNERIPAPVLARAEELLDGADVMLVAGTSCRVAPASFFPGLVRLQGGRIVEVNSDPALGVGADLVLQGGFSRTMQALLAYLDGNVIPGEGHCPCS